MTYFQQAAKARTLLINEYNNLYKSYDVLLTPTAPTPAFAIGENVDDPIKMYLADIMTVPASLAGLPAISVPAGVSATDLPMIAAYRAGKARRFIIRARKTNGGKII